MHTRLLRRGWLVLLVLLVGLSRPAAATHLLGGEMNYKYLDANGPATAPFRYQVTVLVYLNKEFGSAAPDGRPDISIAFYNKSQNGARILNLTVPRTSFAEITPPTPGTCTLPGSAPPRVTLAKYVTTVNLPLSFDGYYAVYTDIARNVDVTNLFNPGNTNMTLYTDMAPPLLPNTSPVFSDTAVAVICQGDTSILLNNAYDADGDRLIYSFGTPYQGNPPFGNFAPPPPPVTYAAGYSFAQPFGPQGYAALNASTGVSRYLSPMLGKFVVAVDVKEYRTINGRDVLVGTTRRDIQLVSRACQPNRPPVFSAPTVQVKNYTVEEGQTLNFNLTATDPEGQRLTMKVNSVLLDGPGPFDATLGGNPGTVPAGNPTGSVSIAGTGTVTGAFRYNAACGNARATPYDVVVTVTDDACGSKTIAEVFRITVTRAAGPNRILGDTVVCDRSQAIQYTAGGPTAASYRWTVRGGTVQGSSTGSSVRVLWGSGTTGTLVLRGVSSLGCPTDSVTRPVDLRPVSTLSISAGVSICPGTNTTLTASGGANYTWTGGGQNFTGASITVAPTQTTTYTVTSQEGTCTASRQVTVTVFPAAVAQAGANRAVCPQEVTTLGAAAVAGYTYQWSPATGLSSTTVAQPTLTLPNTTASPQTFTYTLRVTTAQGCSATSTVTVTVNPPALANAGPDASVCSQQRLRLGTAAVAGYSYEWSPATGLSSTTAAQPTLTAPRATGSAQLLTYVLKATTAAGCVATDTVRITVNPQPEPDNIVGSRSVCPTVQGVAYTIDNPRATAYQWLVEGGTLVSGQGSASITVNWGAASATARVRAFRLSAQGCSSDTVSLPVRINPILATATPTGPARVCQSGGPFTYQTQFTNGSVYAWQILGGTQVSTSQGAVQVRWTRPGVGKLVVTESSNPAGGVCRGQSDTLYVTVLPGPDAGLALAGPSRVCAQAGGTLTFSLPGAASSTYAFTLNGTALTGGTAGSITLPVPAVSATPYTITAQETNANGCAGPVYSKTFVVAPPLAITGPANYCPEARTGLTYSATAFTGGVYQWTLTGGTIVSGQGTSSVRIDLPAGTSAATLQVTETTSQTCAATFTIRPDNATVSLSVASVAAGDKSITLALTVPNVAGNTGRVNILRREAGSTGAFTTVGSAANTATSYTDNTSVDADARAYQYRLELTNGCGTVLASREHTTILTKATGTEPTDTRLTGKTEVTWTAYQGFAVKEYRVSRVVDNGPAQLVATVAAGSPLRAEFQLSKDGFNQCFRVEAVSTDAQPLLARSNDACVDFANRLGFYNIITPNNDGKNDVLIIDNVQLYPSNTLTVFNRWGKQVYETRNYRNTFGGDNCSAGMYYYLFKLQDGTSYKGWFEIAR
ncbi:T9SS type B sorting domain-containing protein [Hymenobacter weizhouensis]|uniref:T9SS type B sorting domain-containing protein n=1 Tax=Hymenobacter sp. YIM 151500-1 TaxID=2987689 RepID=UPI002226E53D|nr:gliding motility-associated C-terminal domain-containing protein [Hymenobacter sp. YIM 151500-1]UYZ63684.1 gliding motility-associated C-terminal domain-containing protein [Hymenobacter sp. YIM 151500-1]